MYLSHIAINKQLRKSRQALAFPQMMHAAVMGSFPPGLTDGSEEGKLRALWRIDYIDEQIWLYVLSKVKPDFKHIVEQFGWQGSEQLWETKEYNDFLDRLAIGQKWHFRLHANPAHTVEGRILPHVTAEHQKKWLIGKAAKSGFAFDNIEIDGESYDTFDIVSRDIIKFKKLPTDKTYVTLTVVTFEGTLVVEDVETLREALCVGVGRAKAYGCGLLTLAKQK